VKIFHQAKKTFARVPIVDVGPREDLEAVIEMTFPSEFMLVAAINRCPCGYFGDLKRGCRGGPLQVQRYRQRISGPLLDRLDLHIEVLPRNTVT